MNGRDYIKKLTSKSNRGNHPKHRDPLRVKLAHILLALSLSISVSASEKENPQIKKEPPVQSIKYYIEQIRPGFKIGVHLAENPKDNDPHLDFIKNNFNAVTIGVYMKGTQKTGMEDWNFTGIDNRIPFALENNMKIKFHPGIGPDTYNPDWLINGGYSADELTEILNEEFKKMPISLETFTKIQDLLYEIADSLSS